MWVWMYIHTCTHTYIYIYIDIGIDLRDLDYRGKDLCHDGWTKHRSIGAGDAGECKMTSHGERQGGNDNDNDNGRYLFLLSLLYSL